MLKSLAVIAIVTLGLALKPAVAEGQARATLTVSARIVDSRPSFEGLEAARAATLSWANGSAVRPTTVTPAVADVRVSYTPAVAEPARRKPGELVVTIEYSRS